MPHRTSRYLSLSFLLVSTLVCRNTFAQANHASAAFGDSVVSHTTSQYPFILGVEGGFGSTKQSGVTDDACQCTTFSTGSGDDRVLAAFVERGVGSQFVAGLKVGVSAMSTRSVNHSSQFAVVQTADAERDTVSGIQLNDVGVAKLAFATVQPYLQYSHIVGDLFLQAGPRFAFLSTSNWKHTHDLVSETAYRSDGTPFHITGFANGLRSEVVTDGAIENVNSILVFASLSVGYDFHVMDALWVVPMVTYDAPLTPVRKNLDDNWRLSSLYGSLALKMPLP